jgi:hypothetical protein
MVKIYFWIWKNIDAPLCSYEIKCHISTDIGAQKTKRKKKERRKVKK